MENPEFWRNGRPDPEPKADPPYNQRVNGVYGSWRTTGPLQIAPDGLGLAWALPAEMCEVPKDSE
jgi:hypothetical protein